MPTPSANFAGSSLGASAPPVFLPGPTHLLVRRPAGVRGRRPCSAGERRQPSFPGAPSEPWRGASLPGRRAPRWSPANRPSTSPSRGLICQQRRMGGCQRRRGRRRSEELDHCCCSGAGTGVDEEKEERGTPTRGCEARPTAERGRHGSTDGGTAAGPLARSTAVRTPSRAPRVEDDGVRANLDHGQFARGCRGVVGPPSSWRGPRCGRVSGTQAPTSARANATWRPTWSRAQGQTAGIHYCRAPSKTSSLTLVPDLTTSAPPTSVATAGHAPFLQLPRQRAFAALGVVALVVGARAGVLEEQQHE
jgi:hypothetical protein